MKNTPGELNTALGASDATAVTATDSFEINESLTLTKPLSVGRGNTLTISAVTGETITGEDAQDGEVSTPVIAETDSYGTLAAGTYTWSGEAWTAMQLSGNF